MSFKDPQMEKVVLSQSDPDAPSKPDEPAESKPEEKETDSPVVLGSGYLVIEKVGEGGMGCVYKVAHLATQDIFAVKVLKSEFAADGNAVDRFKQEALACQELNHPNLVKVYGQGTTGDGLPYIMMEYIEGGSLADLIKKEKRLVAWKANVIFTQIAQAIEHAHQKGIIHRDLKPGNVLLATDENERILVKLVDFGIAKAMAKPGGETMGLTKTGDIFGSPAYMSPEQCLGEPVDHRTDLYSFGCIMYETLTGVNPFYAENAVKSILKHVELYPDSLREEDPTIWVPDELETAVFRCLDKKPQKRIGSASELLKTFTRLSGERPNRSLSWRVIANGFDAIVLGLVLGVVAIWSGTTFGEPFRYLILILIPIYFALSESIMGASFGKLIFSQTVSNGTDGRKRFLRSFFSSSASLASIVLLALCVPLANVILVLARQPVLPDWIQDWAALFVFAALALYWLPVLFRKPSIFEVVFDCRVHDRPQLAPPKNYGRPAPDPRLTKTQWFLGIASFVILTTLPIANELLEKHADSLSWMPKTTVFYAVKDVPEGDTIKADCLEQREISAYRSMQDALHSRSSIEGKVARYGIAAGQIISENDVRNPK